MSLMPKALAVSLAMIIGGQACAQTDPYGSYRCEQRNGDIVVGRYDLQLSRHNAVLKFTEGDHSGSQLVFPVEENGEERISWRLNGSAVEVFNPRTLWIDPEMMFPFVPSDAEQRARLLSEFAARYPRSRCMRVGTP